MLNNVNTFKHLSLLPFFSTFMGRHGQDLDRTRDSRIDDRSRNTRDDNSRQPRTQHRRKSGFRSILIDGLMVLVALLLIAVSVEGVSALILLPRFPTQNYVAINGDTKVAQVRVDPIKELPKDMNVNLTLFDNNGYQNNICSECTKQGNYVTLQGNVIQYPAWLSFFGRYSGFKLTRFEWHTPQSTIGSNVTANSMALSGGDDSLFTRMQGLGWLFVHATRTSINIPVDGKIHNIFISPTGTLSMSQ